VEGTTAGRGADGRICGGGPAGGHGAPRLPPAVPVRSAPRVSQEAAAGRPR
jgi:hypothetical protein